MSRSFFLLLLNSACIFVRVHSFTIHPSQSRRDALSLRYKQQLFGIPDGRVEDIDGWIRLSSESLKKLTGKNLFDRMEDVETYAHVHENERYAVLSHGTQDDPIYKYFNKGAFLTFRWPEDEVYKLPSRYSAPDGAVRSDRAVMMQTVVDQDVREIPVAIRNTKFGEQFQLKDAILWNVYDDSGRRVGQTALFDRTLITPVAMEQMVEGSKNDDQR